MLLSSQQEEEKFCHNGRCNTKLIKIKNAMDETEKKGLNVCTRFSSDPLGDPLHMAIMEEREYRLINLRQFIQLH